MRCRGRAANELAAINAKQCMRAITQLLYTLNIIACLMLNTVELRVLIAKCTSFL